MEYIKHVKETGSDVYRIFSNSKYVHRSYRQADMKQQMRVKHGA